MGPWRTEPRPRTVTSRGGHLSKLAKLASTGTITVVLVGLVPNTQLVRAESDAPSVLGRATLKPGVVLSEVEDLARNVPPALTALADDLRDLQRPAAVPLPPMPQDAPGATVPVAPPVPKPPAPKPAAPAPQAPKPEAKPAPAPPPPKPAQAAPPPVPSVPRHERVGREALGLLRVDPKSLGYEIRFLPARAGYMGMTYSERGLIEIYVRDSQGPREVSWILGHELGHAFDLRRMDYDKRWEWRIDRGIEIETQWFGCNACTDFQSPSGDFAEVYAQWVAGPHVFRSEMAHQPSSSELEALAEKYFR